MDGEQPRLDSGSGQGIPAGLLLAVVISTILSRLPVGDFLFPIPLLMACYGLRRRGITAGVFGLTLILSVGLTALACRDSEGFHTGQFVMIVLIPLAVGTGAALWSMTQGAGLRGYTRFALCALPTTVLSAASVVWLGSDGPAVQTLKAEVSVPLDYLLGGYYSLSGAEILDVFVQACLCSLVPMMVGALGVCIVSASSMARRGDGQWQDMFCRLRIPTDFVWVLLGSFIGAIAGSFAGIPAPVELVLVNLAVLSCVVYAGQGYLILVYRIRRRNPYYASHRLLKWLLLLTLIPLTSPVMIAGLPLLGVLETWIVLRKPNKEDSYEDHFES